MAMICSIEDSANYLFKRGITKAAARARIAHWLKRLTEREAVLLFTAATAGHTAQFDAGHDGLCYCDCELAALCRKIEGNEKSER